LTKEDVRRQFPGFFPPDGLPKYLQEFQRRFPDIFTPDGQLKLQGLEDWKNWGTEAGIPADEIPWLYAAVTCGGPEIDLEWQRSPR
jgi:hypothetical protein